MAKLDNIKLFVFDLGGTLMEYKGMHLSWTGYYKGAFEYVNTKLGLGLSEQLIADSIPTLAALKKAGFKIAAMTDVATGMPDLMHKNYVTPLLPYFDLYVSSLSCGYKKPNPKGLRDISEQLGIEPENMVMIGDTNRDVNVAKNIGCRSILTNRKDEPVQELGQDFTIRNTLEILALIQL